MKSFVRFTTLFWLLLCGPAWPRGGGGEVGDRLETARGELRLAEAAERRVAARLEALRADPDSTPAEIEAMETYLEEIRAVARVRRETLADLEALAGEPVEAPDAEVQEGMRAFEEAVAEVPSAEDPETEAERLEREFEASLEAFDAMILEHERRLESQMAARMAKGEEEAAGHASAAAEAEEILRSMGVDPGEGLEETGGEGEAKERVAGAETDERPSTAGEPARETADAGEAEGRAGAGGGREPREDEDIVARQLREAAEKEEDPELREKLWKEYEAYLDGRS